MPIKFVKFSYRKFSSKGGGKLHGFVKISFISQDRKKLRQGTILCCRKLLVGKNILSIGGGRGRVSRFSVEKFLSDCTRIFHWRTLWWFRKTLLSKIFMHRRGASRFCRNFLSHRTETKIFVNNPSVFQKISGIEKNLWIRRGISRLSVEIFMSHSAEKFRKGILLWCLREFPLAEKFMDKRGGVSIFSVENFRRGTP